jgi:hypothetical protein
MMEAGAAVSSWVGATLCRWSASCGLLNAEFQMAKKPGRGKCVHCLDEDVARNWDHVFPESWYPDNTEDNLLKWKAPSCLACNERLGVIERDFLHRVAMNLDPLDPATASIVARAKRARDPEAATSERDRRARTKLREKIRGDVLFGSNIPVDATYPGLHDRWGQQEPNRAALLIPVSYFQDITRKIVAGFVYHQDKKFIDSPFQIEFFDADRGQMFVPILDRFGEIHAREPGLKIRRAVAPEDGMSSVFEILFWHQFRTYATVTSAPEGQDQA